MTNQTEYGYEVWVTIDNDIAVNGSLVKAKTFQGGLYAVCGVKNLTGGRDGSEIYDTWQRFSRWHFNDKFEHIAGIISVGK